MGLKTTAIMTKEHKIDDSRRGDSTCEREPGDTPLQKKSNKQANNIDNHLKKQLMHLQVLPIKKKKSGISIENNEQTHLG